MNKALLVIGLALILGSCGNRESAKPGGSELVSADSASAVADSIVKASTAVTTEHYYGKLPCADCAGIDTELTLKSDSTWSLHIIYDKRPSKGPGSNEFSEEGQWMMHGADTVHLMGRKDAPSLFIRTDSTMIQLDMQGKRIEGKLADKYILKKI
jgi:uncharacterized lipoprotein NlpE involved in copper resistance